MKRKIPPFAKGFKPTYLDKDFNLARIYFGWEGKGKGIVIPPNESPLKFHWSFLKDCHVIVFGDAVSEYREDLASELLKIGALKVCFILPKCWIEVGQCGICWGSEYEIYD